MSLSFLYKANADLSFQMAGAAKTPEMRKQWTDLAVHWLKKAEMGDQFSELGTKHLDDGPTISPGVLAPAVPPLVENQDLIPPLTPRDRRTLAAVWTAFTSGTRLEAEINERIPMATEAERFSVKSDAASQAPVFNFSPFGRF